jgi:Ca-activated chloride channel family protein
MIAAVWQSLSMAFAEPAAEAAAAASVFDDFGFLHLDRVWLLAPIALAVGAYFWGAHRRRKVFEALGNQELVARLVSSVNHNARLLRAIFVLCAMAALMVGLMRPQYGGVAKVKPSSGLDIVVVVDYSKSMLAQDVYPSRSKRLEAELSHFLDDAERRGDRVGLVIFAGGARGLPVTSDMSLLDLYLQKADPKTEEPGGTAIGKALTLAVEFLVEARSDAQQGEQQAEVSDQVIILLTDGEDTVSRPQEVAEEAAELGIHIYAVGIGSRSGEPIVKLDAEGNKVGFQTDESGNYVLTRLDEDTLKQLAETTRGSYVRVDPDSFSLDKVRGMFSDLSRAQRESTVHIYRQEGYLLAVIPALIFLCLGLVMGDRRRRSS